MRSADFKQLRAAAGLSQAKLSEISGINVRQIQKIEAGEIKPENITLGNAVRLSHALGIPVEQLLA